MCVHFFFPLYILYIPLLPLSPPYFLPPPSPCLSLSFYSICLSPSLSFPPSSSFTLSFFLPRAIPFLHSLSQAVVMATVVMVVIVVTATAALVPLVIIVLHQDEMEEGTHRQVVEVVPLLPDLLVMRYMLENTSWSRQLGRETLLKSNWQNTCLLDKRLVLCILYMYTYF